MSGNGGSYLNQGGTNDGKKIIATTLDPFSYSILGPGDGNTDGYDLDAIRVQGPDVLFGNRHLKPTLTIDKVTNGSDGPFIEKGASSITWTYKVTNTGECDLSKRRRDRRQGRCGWHDRQSAQGPERNAYQGGHRCRR